VVLGQRATSEIHFVFKRISPRGRLPGDQ
jgi:hypothetical protein